MHIETTRNPKSTCHLLRQSYWENGKPRKRTLCNLSALPEHAIEALRKALKRGPVLDLGDRTATVLSSRAHGAASAILGMAQSCELDRILFHRSSRQRSLALAMIAGRLLRPGAKLRLERELSREGSTTLGVLLGIEGATVDELYDAMDWLRARQASIERKLARRHLTEGGLVMFDVSSGYFEGSACRLARLGYSRDHRRDRPQVVYGMLCTAEGCPVAIEVFAGNTADPMTLAGQVCKMRDRFGIRQIVLVGDRGMITQARIDEDLAPADVHWITALRADTIRKLARKGTIAPDHFQPWQMARVCSPDFPGEGLIVCFNPLLAAERRRKRNALLQTTEDAVRDLADLYQQGSIDRDELDRRLGAVHRRKMAMHFLLHFEEPDATFSFERNAASIDAEARLDGLHVIRTNLDQTALDDADTVRASKALARVEQAFRSLKTLSLRDCPIFHWHNERVRAHFFLCMLAYYLEWHMRRKLKPLMFAEETPPRNENPVAPAPRSKEVRHKPRTRRTPDGLPVHGFRDLLEHLGTLCATEIDTGNGFSLSVLTRMTSLQEKAFSLLGLKPHPAPQSSEMEARPRKPVQ